MAGPDVPPGWRHNPSTWARRWPALVLSLTGCGIATYLTLYQVHVLPAVWEPFFGNGSTRILRESSIAHFFDPIPDACLGAFAYFAEAVLDGIGGSERWRTTPWVVLLLGLCGCGLGLTGLLLLVICQPLLYHAFCTLCLASAACSLLIAASVADEVWATLKHICQEHAHGRSWWHAVLGPGTPDRKTASGLRMR